jgi:hypothetical protein
LNAVRCRAAPDPEIRSFGKEAHPGLAHRAHRLLERAVDVDAATSGRRDRDFETSLAAVDRRKGDAEIGGEPAQGEAAKPGFLEIAGEPGRRLAVVLAECRIGVDRASEPFSDNQLRMRGLEPRVERRALRLLHAMVRPQDLRAVGDLDRLERPLAAVRAGE